MTSEQFLKFANTYEIRPVIDINRDLCKGVQALFNQVCQIEPSIHYIPPTDRRVLNMQFSGIYLGESLRYAITQIENECEVQFTLTDTEDNGVEVSLEYYPRVLSFKEVINYRRTHLE